MKIRIWKHKFRLVKKAPEQLQFHLTIYVFTSISLAVLPSIRKTLCGYEGLLEQLLIYLYWNQRSVAVPAISLLLTSISLIFTHAEHHQGVPLDSLTSNSSAPDSRKARRYLQFCVWFDRAKTRELLTYEKWQIGDVFSCVTDCRG